MKIKGTVRPKTTKLGTFGVLTSLGLAEFANKDVEADVIEVKPKEKRK